MTKHTFEIAPTGRSKCRGCSRSIEKDSLRFGERVPNAFGDGDATQWLHPLCAAHRRPAAIGEALAELAYDAQDKAELLAVIETGESHPRLQRIGVAERASSGRARCRYCQELIEQNAWRLPLMFFDEGVYSSSGFIHASCAAAYCEIDGEGDSAAEAVWQAAACFAGELDASDREELRGAIFE